jgi:hypothetical protein
MVKVKRQSGNAAQPDSSGFPARAIGQPLTAGIKASVFSIGRFNVLLYRLQPID